MRALRGLFLSADHASARLPVVLLSGALGAGKTTLVNALLTDPRLARTAVAVNEFGAIPLDADLIDHGADKTLVLANGCLCCNVEGDLEEAILRVFTRQTTGDLPTFERLIIEPSGLADPAPIATSLLRNPLMAAHFRLEAIVTVVDCLHIGTQIARDPIAAKQIALADTVILTKADLVSSETLAARRDLVCTLNPVAPIERAENGHIDAAQILPASFLSPDGWTDALPARALLLSETVAPPHDLSGIVAVSIEESRPLDWRKLDAWLRGIRLRHGERLLRVKGLACIAGRDGPILLNGVHHVLHAPIALDSWPAHTQSTRLVLIVERAIASEIRHSWTATLETLIA